MHIEWETWNDKIKKIIFLYLINIGTEYLRRERAEQKSWTSNKCKSRRLSVSRILDFDLCLEVKIHWPFGRRAWLHYVSTVGRHLAHSEPTLRSARGKLDSDPLSKLRSSDFSSITLIYRFMQACNFYFISLSLHQRKSLTRILSFNFNKTPNNPHPIGIEKVKPS